MFASSGYDGQLETRTNCDKFARRRGCQRRFTLARDNYDCCHQAYRGYAEKVGPISPSNIVLQDDFDFPFGFALLFLALRIFL